MCQSGMHELGQGRKFTELFAVYLSTISFTSITIFNLAKKRESSARGILFIKIFWFRKMDQTGDDYLCRFDATFSFGEDSLQIKSIHGSFLFYEEKSERCTETLPMSMYVRISKLRRMVNGMNMCT